MSGRLDDIRHMTETVKDIYRMFGPDGELNGNRMEDLMPLSVRKSGDISDFWHQTVAGLEGLMKCLVYSEFVETDLRGNGHEHCIEVR